MIFAVVTATNSLVPFSYVVGIVVGLTGIIFASVKWYQNQRRNWVDEGEHAQKQAEAMDRNTKAATRNTEAIGTLTTELRTFVSEVRLRLAGQDGLLSSHENRLTRLEQNGHGPWRRAPAPVHEPPEE